MRFKNFKNNLKNLHEILAIGLVVMGFFEILSLIFGFKEFSFIPFLISVIIVTIFTMFWSDSE